MTAPDGTAVRVALWRALHVELDPPPHLLDDTIGLRLAQPPSDWRARGDMSADATASFRASIVARARFLDDLVRDRASAGVEQYVVLGAGLDSFAQRHPNLALRIYEVDQPGTQEWKRRRLAEEGLTAPVFVPVDFENGETWRNNLQAKGFDAMQPAVVSSTGVSMYLTAEANYATLRQVAALAPGSVLAMTFMLPLDLLDDAERPSLANVEAQARNSGTPFLSHYAPGELVALCRDAGFTSARHVSPAELTELYLTDRTDRLRLPNAEHIVVAEV